VSANVVYDVSDAV